MSSACEERMRSLRFSPAAQTLVYACSMSGGMQEIPLCKDIAGRSLPKAIVFRILLGETEYSIYPAKPGDVVRKNAPSANSETHTEETAAQDTTEPVREAYSEVETSQQETQTSPKRILDKKKFEFYN